MGNWGRRGYHKIGVSSEKGRGRKNESRKKKTRRDKGKMRQEKAKVKDPMPEVATKKPMERAKGQKRKLSLP